MINDAVKLLATMEGNKKKVSSNVGISTADISEAILEAARTLALGTSDLITAAAAAQAERKEASRDYSRKYNADPAWANGLVSAAQSVAQNVRTLVAAANATAKGTGGEEERLIAASKAVAAVTVQLLHASRTKAEDPTAKTQRDLSKAANNVSVSSGQLVVAAQAAQEFKEQASEDKLFNSANFSAATGIMAQMEQQSKISKLEKELRDTHQELIKLRRARYAQK